MRNSLSPHTPHQIQYLYTQRGATRLDELKISHIFFRWFLCTFETKSSCHQQIQTSSHYSEFHGGPMLFVFLIYFVELLDERAAKETNKISW